MNTRNVRISVLFLVVFFSSVEAVSQTPVKVYGELRAIMQRGDLSPKVSLDTMNFTPTTIGLGVVAGLKGEIIIIEGKPYRSYLRAGKIVIEQSKDMKAAMLVTSDLIQDHIALENDPKESVSRSPVTTISSLTGLENFLDRYAKQAKISTVSFMIDVPRANVTYHVIDWQDGVGHTPENHKQFASNGKLVNEPVTLIGFYAQNGAGIFTPHTSKIHVHVYCPSKGVVGHVEELQVNGEVEIKIVY